ncbi:chromosomal replication initiator protein DnaA [[Clostridium] symbiosum]|uniref:chromosomal replication initiator protein DnaA n=1 Tax=Clostridium symbiosum TaxID=1512 RepID=UPI001D0628D2|nr:chromosomal replication initiator protein DnaA [[Clostridium] symbiosum]MCB6609758.1 chromosomal replication initiator protein DnaA [[Clostridium] symbiosum]MCB6931287.1 chromosomal replication initiator protein DnaA [[Clostridium] symbiosum]
MLEKIKEKWDQILLHIKEEHELTDVSFKTWLLPTEPYAVKGNTLQILVPDIHFLGYIKKKYGFLLQITIEELTEIECELEFVTAEQVGAQDEADRNQLINRPLEVNHQVIQNANLNPRYTFDSFVVGANNNLAHAASLAVAESPGEIYNPLFIYGGVGLGKTHLMHSIGHFILKNNPKAKVLYVTSEKFTNELIDAIRNKNNISTTEFREKYRNNDILLIDDIQFIIGKESTQEEFFHTFNSLYEAKKQIIISSDKPPKEIETLEERLRSRFEWGLTVDIQSPDYETRMAILRKKEELEGYNIDNEVIKYIATNVKSNIRELEGALTKIVALSKLNKREITIELAEEALKDLISPNELKEVTPELIIQVVADHFGITPLDISSQKRNKEVVFPRQIVMYLCRSMTETPLQAIGKYLGGRDHTTIIHGYEKIGNDMEKNESLRNTIEILKKKINPQ